MPRQTNNKKQSTSQAQEDIPASTAKTDECLSAEDINLIEDQQKTIDKLMKRIITLEGKFHELEGRLLITQTVNRHLESMIDSQVQYSCRPCLVINGMAEPRNESDDEKLVVSRLKEETGIDEDVIQQNIDKIHPIGQPEDGKQRRIVKFTSDSFKERVFMKHKQRKKPCIEKQKKTNKPVSIRFNLQPSLTKRRLELLQYAKEKLAAVKEIKFPYADMHGNLKVVLNTPIRNRYVVGFKTKEDVGQILESLGTNDYEGISYEEY